MIRNGWDIKFEKKLSMSKLQIANCDASVLPATKKIHTSPLLLFITCTHLNISSATIYNFLNIHISSLLLFITSTHLHVSSASFYNFYTSTRLLCFDLWLVHIIASSPFQPFYNGRHLRFSLKVRQNLPNYLALVTIFGGKSKNVRP